MRCDFLLFAVPKARVMAVCARCSGAGLSACSCTGEGLWVFPCTYGRRTGRSIKSWKDGACRRRGQTAVIYAEEGGEVYKGRVEEEDTGWMKLGAYEVCWESDAVDTRVVNPVIEAPSKDQPMSSEASESQAKVSLEKRGTLKSPAAAANPSEDDLFQAEPSRLPPLNNRTAEEIFQIFENPE